MKEMVSYERDGFNPNGVMTSYFSVRYVKK